MTTVGHICCADAITQTLCVLCVLCRNLLGYSPCNTTCTYLEFIITSGGWGSGCLLL